MRGVVLQDPYLFSGTVEDNIRLGTEGISRADVELAAGQVNLTDFIQSLPDGFEQAIREHYLTSARHLAAHVEQ